MADEITKEMVAEAVADAIKTNNATRDEAETGLKAKLDEVLAEKKAAAAHAKEETAKAVAAAEESARKSGDVEALEKSWTDKHAALQSEYDAKSADYTSAINKLTAGAAAKDIAAALAVKGSEGVLEQLIAPRLGVDIRDGVPIVTVLDESGKPSALTVDEFRQSLSSNEALKPLLAGTQGNGGGAANLNGGAETTTISREQFNALSHVDRAAFAKSGGKAVDA